MALRSVSSALKLAQAYKTYASGMCLKFVRSLYNVPVVYPDAATAWRNTKYRHTSTPPKGVPVWWTGGSRGFGHVAISAGGGYVISTDYPSKGRVGKVKISTLTKAWGQTYRGWSEDINGYRVYKAAKKEAKYKPPAFPKGIGPRKSKPSAVKLQRALKKAGFMPKSVKENPNYGPQTRAAVARFHDKYPKYKSPGVKYDPRIGPKGWKKLFTLAYG